MSYGHFEGREYVITNPRTPVKWINYVGTIDFGGFVDHTGGLLVCKGDPALNRITKYITQLPSSEFKGSTIYLRGRRGDRSFLYSPYYVPTLHEYDRYECRIGLGYSRFLMEYVGIRTEITVFVPEGESVVLQDVRIRNTGSDTVEVLDLIPVVEYSHFDALKQLTNADWVPQTMTSKAIGRPGGLLVLRQCAFMQTGRAENFLTSNSPVSSFEADRRRFLGENEYGTWKMPFSLVDGREFSNYEPLRGDNVGALMHHVGPLAPGEERRVIVQLGQVESVEKAMPLIERFREPEEVDAAFARMQAFWEEYLNVCQVETPDPEFDLLVNTHNPRQCYVTLNWSRYLSYYQLGYGARGIGVRDSSQDVMAVVAGAPGRAKKLLRKLLSVQKRNGSSMHQFNPKTMEATMGDAREMEDRPQYYGDDHLWLVFAVCHYIAETGDYAFLEEEIPFYEKDKEGRPLESARVLEHLERALAFTWNDTGVHGIPHLGFADWNDTVNLKIGAESFFIAHQFSKAARDLADLMDHLGKKEKAETYRSYAEEMKRRVNEVGWDGEWYLRYFDWDGSPIGSRGNVHGKIYTNAQSWAVISGNATPERARKALDAVYTHLNTRYGIKLSTPGYDHYDPNLGGVTTYPPGAKENGGIFLHANPWVIIAECMMGNGERAYQYHRQVNPIKKNEIIDIYEVEPYVFCQNILGDEHPQFGLGRNSWLTGTASWMYQAATQYILGVRVTHSGIVIDPCLPSEWEGFRMRRKVRGTWYEITVRNPEHVSRGVQSCTLDGEAVEVSGGAARIPFDTEGKDHVVEVILGA
ncbi:glycosyltransferase 36 [Spirochaeta thermophila DSM 6578]|uniref:Glycosyltransferase 36 n=1 Tax=Winmispira thermophila (strain ATCC 700085 / DSM 6578 / Z-1203) TaxID=869211 RepID=G0GFK3_WINT7|nr:glycosyl hydrolase family 65 protein [Spirochaeta thermophila]AEJ62402.1 glycosyltransferase 36 [Spirochaeta thermophila DSM 6578]